MKTYIAPWSFPLTENPLDIFAEDLGVALRCPMRRRWLICTPWLAIPSLMKRAWRKAERNARAYHLSPWRRFAVMAEQWNSLGVGKELQELGELCRQIGQMTKAVKS